MIRLVALLFETAQLIKTVRSNVSIPIFISGILAICGADQDLSEVCSQLMFIKVQLPGTMMAQFDQAAKEPESSTL